MAWEAVVRPAHAEHLGTLPMRWIARRMAFTGASLAGAWAAVAAGLGITLRTSLGLPASVRQLDAALPKPGTLGLALHRPESELAPATAWLASITRQDLRAATNDVPASRTPAKKIRNARV